MSSLSRDALPVRTRFELSERVVHVLDDLGNRVPKIVCGSACTEVVPQGIGIGRLTMQLQVELAKRLGYDCVVGFCDPELVPFYNKIGWFVYEQKSGDPMVASCKLNDPVYHGSNERFRQRG